MNVIVTEYRHASTARLGDHVMGPTRVGQRVEMVVAGVEMTASGWVVYARPLGRGAGRRVGVYADEDGQVEFVVSGPEAARLSAAFAVVACETLGRPVITTIDGAEVEFGPDEQPDDDPAAGWADDPETATVDHTTT